MSELEKTAPNEIYLIVGDTDKDCNFNELAEVTWADKPIYEETAIKYVKSSQLMIPQGIADWLDKAFEEYSEEGRMVSTILTMQIIRNVSKRKDIEEWFMHYSVDRLNLALAYLAGKALGVDLVKVVEG
ncbi:hypothetical protein [Lactococcus cremoris]|uniref:hypothetical protein n=1 Tax=Lactococcus lactis subsp. cremoris TaxID=1359 RepID=UPI0024A7151A|nr:hypothetical protein [Lactococcus cremoris]